MCCSLTSQFALWAWNNWWNWKFSLHPSSVLISFQSDVQGLWSFRPELKHNQHQWGSTGHVDVLSGPLESNEIICVIAVFMLRPPHPCLNFLPNHSNRKSCITHSTVTNAFLCIYRSHECFFLQKLLAKQELQMTLLKQAVEVTSFSREACVYDLFHDKQTSELWMNESSHKIHLLEGFWIW